MDGFTACFGRGSPEETELEPQKMKQANVSIRMLTPIGVGILAMTGFLEDSDPETKLEPQKVNFMVLTGSEEDLDKETTLKTVITLT